MKVNVRSIEGNWYDGYSLDKHIVSSTPSGTNQWGYTTFDTVRTEIGESVFQLKYRDDFNQVQGLASAVVENLGEELSSVSCVIPMPASKSRNLQPVSEVSKSIAQLLGVQYVDYVLLKVKQTSVMKDLSTREERQQALYGCFQIDDKFYEGPWDVLLVDDLYDTGASLEAACEALRSCSKVNKIFVVALTRKK